jgi:hypothetical protein
MSYALNVSIRPPSNEENHTSEGTRGDFMSWQSNTARRKCAYEVRLGMWSIMEEDVTTGRCTQRLLPKG